MQERGTRGAVTRIHLVQAEESEPRVRLAAGKTYEVVATSIVDSDFAAVAEEVERPTIRPARLCGSHSTCVAIIEID